MLTQTECTLTDINNAVGNGNVGKSPAAAENPGADPGNAASNNSAAELFAVGKRPVAYHRHTVRDRKEYCPAGSLLSC